MSDPALDHWDAYRNSSFLVETALGRLCLRIGETSQKLDQIMETSGVDSWAFVTAFNPGSVSLSRDENDKRQARLRADVAAANFAFLEGEGIGSDGDWPPEASILILGLTQADAVDLGRKYGQSAIVAGLKGLPAVLVRC